jgi:hypothetical protein
MPRERGKSGPIVQFNVADMVSFGDLSQPVQMQPCTRRRHFGVGVEAPHNLDGPCGNLAGFYVPAFVQVGKAEGICVVCLH